MSAKAKRLGATSFSPPHFQSQHGVLQEIGSKVLERFACDRLCGYELGDDKLPADFREDKNPGKFLLPFMASNRAGVLSRQRCLRDRRHRGDDTPG